MFFVRVFNHWIADKIRPGIIVITDGMVRETAHFFEYLVLGSLLFLGFFEPGRPRQTITNSIITGALYAISDEVHQYFVPGRHLRLIDLAVDSTGVVIGIFLFAMISGCLRRPISS